MLGSVALWQSSPDMVAVLRSVADEMEQLRQGRGGAVLGDERRKTGWMRAEAASDPGP
jgi:hypothetical protein